MSESLSAIYLSFNERQKKKITRKQDMVFFSIIWPNYSRLLSKRNKSTQNLCASMCACAHKHIQDFVCLVRGRKDIKPPNISSWWQRVLQGQHLRSKVRAVPKLGDLLPQLKLDSNMRNSNKTEVYPSLC